MVYESELYHHGILGQKWGKKNGPPYPLGSGGHSSSEKKAGWKKSLDKTSSEDDNNKKKDGFHLSDKQKKALKVGAAVAATALAAYGLYKLSDGSFSQMLISSGKKSIDVSPIKDTSYNDVENIMESISDSRFPKKFSEVSKLNSLESLDNTLKVVNPYRNTLNSSNPVGNCMSCSLASFLRRFGYDAYATDVNKFDFIDAIKKIFPNYSMTDGSLIDYDLNSRASVSKALKEAFGDNSSGVLSVMWKGRGYGHAFNWEIKNGVVSFFDGQNARSDSDITDYVFSQIDTTVPYLTKLFSLNADAINLDELRRYVSGKR